MKKLTNQSIKLFLTVLATAFVFAGYAETVTSIAHGNWDEGTTWSTGSQPAAGDDVVVVHQVLVREDVAELLGSITIEADVFSGNLQVQTYTISTAGNFEITEGGSISAATGAVVTVGDGPEDGFIMEGTQMAVTGGTLNVSGYFHLNSGKFAASNDVEINVATAGTRNDDIINIYFDPDAELDFNNVALTLNLKNGNQGTGEEMHLDETLLSNYTGSININISNEFNTVDDYVIITNADANDIVIDIGAGNECAIQNTTDYTGDKLSLQDIEVASGAFKLVEGTFIKLSEAFTGITTGAITIDGILYVGLNLTLNSNLIGNGTVYAGTYAVGSNTVFGNTIVVPDDNASYFAASTWYGTTNNDWFTGSNWQTGTPPASTTDVTIWSGAPNSPVINASGATAKNFIINAGTSLKINSGGNFTSNTGLQMINNSGTLTIDGGTFDFSGGVKAINNAASTITIDNGGQMTITLDQSATARKMDNLDAINLNGNSSLTITGSLEMGSSSSLDIQGGSSVEIKQ